MSKRKPVIDGGGWGGWGRMKFKDLVANVIVHEPACGPEEAMPDGKRWSDMPGHGEIWKRCNFFFYRRGMIDLVEMESGKFFNAQSIRRADRSKVKRSEGSAAAGLADETVGGER